MEQIQYQNSKYPSINNFLTIYQPNDLIFGFSATDSNAYYNLISFGQNYNQRSSNSPLPIWYTEYGDDIMVFIIYQFISSNIISSKL